MAMAIPKPLPIRCAEGVRFASVCNECGDGSAAAEDMRVKMIRLNVVARLAIVEIYMIVFRSFVYVQQILLILYRVFNLSSKAHII